MIFSNPDKCTECQFEDGKHSQDCSKYVELDFEEDDNEDLRDVVGQQNAQDLEGWKFEKP